MAYVKAVLGALVAALVLGAGTGAVEVLTGAVARLRSEDKAVVYAVGVSVAMNCAAFFVLVFVPLAVVLVFAVRRWRRRPTPGRAA
jgi:membrane protein implicated in regulation of membrane protease activity